jgi:hypothetical protein
MDFSWFSFYSMKPGAPAAYFVSFNKTNLPSGIGSQTSACLHQIMPLRRDETNLHRVVNTKLFPAMLRARPTERRHHSKFIGLMPPLFFGVRILLTSAPASQ